MSATASEPLSSPAEEARRLLEALADWASTRLGADDEHLATGSAECQVCPVCQLISALRGNHAELVARLGAAWTALLRELGGHSHPPTPSAEPESEPEVARPTRPVQNIDVR